VRAAGAVAGALVVVAEVAAGAVAAGAVAAGAVVFTVASGAVVLDAPEVPVLFAPDAPPVAEDFGWLPPVAVESVVSSTGPASPPAPHPEPVAPAAATTSARIKPFATPPDLERDSFITPSYEARSPTGRRFSKLVRSGSSGVDAPLAFWRAVLNVKEREVETMKGVVLTFSAVVTALVLAGSGARAESPVGDDTSAATAKQIIGKLRADPELANNKIEVHVDKGVATLKGKVDSQMEKSRAVTLAAVPGVKIVDDQLKVASEGAKAIVTDSAITTSLKAKFVADSTVRSADISVDTNNGVVTLSGTAPSQAAHTLAIDMARSTDGVRRVDDQIKVLETSTR
jgi:hyperosmotically inducible periplasmic protein